MTSALLTTPDQRAALKKTLGRNLPSVNELYAAIVVPQGTLAQPAEKKRFLGVDALWPDKAKTPAAPPSLESVEQAWKQLEVMVEGLRLHGLPEEKIARLLALAEKELIAQKVPSG